MDDLKQPEQNEFVPSVMTAGTVDLKQIAEEMHAWPGYGCTSHEPCRCFQHTIKAIAKGYLEAVEWAKWLDEIGRHTESAWLFERKSLIERAEKAEAKLAAKTAECSVLQSALERCRELEERNEAQGT